MNQPFPEDLARQHALALQRQLDENRCIDFESEKQLSTDLLFGPARGQMFGILVCRDKAGNEVVLKAFSGQYGGRYLVDGWVPPVCDPDRFASVVSRYDGKIHALTEQAERETGSRADELRQERKALSRACLHELYGLFRFRTIDGALLPLVEICTDRIPPTGMGDCCAPKLLHYAFSNDLHPVSMAEFYYGKENRSKTREHKRFYGPCDDKCRPLLHRMLGLDIVYCDPSLVVVNKDAGLLSVPGRGEENRDSVETRIRRLFPHSIGQPAVHRLDMDTSGLLLLCLDAAAHRNLSRQFMERSIEKSYVALLEGVVKERTGTIDLPFRLDVENRPRQIYDRERGKRGLTHWEKLDVEYIAGHRQATRVRFVPKTGRTHQLRVHSAHHYGLGHPIVGDRLYGNRDLETRMYLHATTISFLHPVTGTPMHFESSPPF
jgi:tRNA pseudouridine32 synthase/23S rRNA pseudouridine746 synthase